jgi:hypothetical protein
LWGVNIFWVNILGGLTFLGVNIFGGLTFLGGQHFGGVQNLVGQNLWGVKICGGLGKRSKKFSFSPHNCRVQMVFQNAKTNFGQVKSFQNIIQANIKGSYIYKVFVIQIK